MFYTLWQDKRHFWNNLCDVNSVVCHEMWEYMFVLEKIYRNIVLIIILIGMSRLTCTYNIALYLMLTQF